MFNRPLPLKCTVQHSDWGKPAPNSLVAQLAGIAQGDAPCAELWMGAHPRAPSKALIGSFAKNLDALVSEHQHEILGSEVTARWGEIPFLFKVLSIASPLSIQLHPNRSEAELLHQKDPAHYPDRNHKPEVAIAITPVELLYGVKTPAEIRQILQQYPEFASLVPTAGLYFDSNFSRHVFESSLTAEEKSYSSAIAALTKRLSNQGVKLSRADEWFLSSTKRFDPSDKGLVCFYLMNLCRISAGQAMFTAAGVPHAYLSGDLVECMANSDNVVRAGLTAKFQDRETLFRLLDYTVQQPRLIEPQSLSATAGRIQYSLPTDEFRVESITGKGEFSLQIEAVSIALCTQGTGSMSFDNESLPVSKGSVFLLPAALKNCKIINQDAVLFIASVPLTNSAAIRNK